MIGEPLRERIRSLDRREWAGLLVIVVLIVAGAALWYLRSLPSPVHIEASTDRRGPAGLAAPATSPTPATIIVDVAGWVRRPGVYDFRQGDRVIDAIRMAGGARPGADLTSINLAALLTDAQQIVVPKKGKPSAGGPGSGGGPGAPGSGGAEPLINLNTATLDQLESLPGIGPALGQRILDYRQEHGPFRSVDDLLNVSGIGDKRLADLRSKVTV
ncbi:MAG TPA: ComEA family DNA-binding protein [Actinomycetota bacterium]